MQFFSFNILRYLQSVSSSIFSNLSYDECHLCQVSSSEYSKLVTYVRNGNFVNKLQQNMEISSQKRPFSPDIFSTSPSSLVKKSKNVKPARKESDKKLLEAFKDKLKKLLPEVFEKDTGRGNFIFELFCDIIRMNNLIDTCDDMGCLEFVMTEQRISRALDSFFSIRGVFFKAGHGTTTGRCLDNYMNPYRSQFQELSEIGSGGFGYVVKAKHHLDGIVYAVKKVVIERRRRKEIISCLNEVTILAQLNHPNVVGYKQAWIEPYNGTEIPQSSQSPHSCSQASTDYLSSIRKDFGFFHLISSHANNDREEPLTSDEASQSSQEEEPRIVLYIQMRLCENTLREWMDARKAHSESSEIEKIATQILKGVDYIHSQDVIHHDIKPQNIFISLESGKFSVQLGDFGLACECQKEQHSQRIGTSLYAAPEQLEKKCDPKSDIYSFGIVLFELMYPMRTEMERTTEITNLKNGKLPCEIEERYRDWVRVLKKSLHDNPTSRPSAGEILNNLREEEVAKLKEVIEKLKEENSLLKSQIHKSDGVLCSVPRNKTVVIMRYNRKKKEDDQE